MPAKATPPADPAQELLALGRQWLASSRRRRPQLTYEHFYPMLELCASQGMTVREIVRELLAARKIKPDQTRRIEVAFYRHLEKKRTQPA